MNTGIFKNLCFHRAEKKDRLKGRSYCQMLLNNQATQNIIDTINYQLFFFGSSEISEEQTMLMLLSYLLNLNKASKGTPINDNITAMVTINFNLCTLP